MKKVRTPFFEVGIKNYLYGDEVLELAAAADRAASEYNVDVLFVTPYTEIRRIAENTERLIVFAPYMDLLSPGRGMADILPEALKAAGADGVVLNHSERPVSVAHLMQGIQRAKNLEMLSFVCTGSIGETRAAACLHPDILNPEPPELIGTGAGGDSRFFVTAKKAVKEIDEKILVEHAAGIRSPEEVYQSILSGAEGVGAASGICLAANPGEMAREMIAAVRRAQDERR